MKNIKKNNWLWFGKYRLLETHTRFYNVKQPTIILNFKKYD